MQNIDSVPIIKLAVFAAIGVVVLNGVLGLIFGFGEIASTIGVAVAVPGCVAIWYTKVVRRAPSAAERSRFLWVYGGIIASMFVAVTFLGTSTAWSIPGLLILLAYYLPYPAFAELLLSEKMFKSLPRP